MLVRVNDGNLFDLLLDCGRERVVRFEPTPRPVIALAETVWENLSQDYFFFSVISTLSSRNSPSMQDCTFCGFGVAPGTSVNRSAGVS